MMKKIKLTLLLALCAVALTGCSLGEVDTNSNRLNGFDDAIVSAEYNGHSYIIYKGVKKGGITHDPDCPCHKTDSER